MATRTTAASTAGYVDPLRGLYGGAITAGQDYLTNGTRVQDRNRLTLEIIHVTAISDADTLATGILGIQSVAFQCDEGQTTADPTSVHIDDAIGTLRFKVEGSATGRGWVWLLIDPVASHRAGYPGR